jgi:hypothetical protein
LSVNYKILLMVIGILVWAIIIYRPQQEGRYYKLFSSSFVLGLIGLFFISFLLKSGQELPIFFPILGIFFLLLGVLNSCQYLSIDRNQIGYGNILLRRHRKIAVGDIISIKKTMSNDDSGSPDLLIETKNGSKKRILTDYSNIEDFIMKLSWYHSEIEADVKLSQRMYLSISHYIGSGIFLYLIFRAILSN